MENFDLKAWEKKRRRTVMAFRVECLLLGMEYSLTFMTLWLYITTLVKTEHPELFYGFISAAYLLSTVIFSVTIGRMVDRTRSVQLAFFVCNSFVIVGNVIYAIHHSPWFLVVGRFLAGVGGALRPIVSGEISRSFPSDQQTSEFSANGVAFAIGFIVGPGVNFLFNNVDFELFIYHITAANVPGIYMAGFFLLAQLSALFTIHDLSKEYDLKAYNELKDSLQTTCEASKEITKEVTVSSESISTEKDLKVEGAAKHFAINEIDDCETPLLQSQAIEASPLVSPQTIKLSNVSSILLQDIKHFDVALVFFLTFTLNFWIVALDMWLPMLVIDVLHMGITGLNAIIFGSGCIAVLGLLLFTYKQFSDKAVFRWSLGSLLSLTLMEAILASMMALPPKLYLSIILWVIWALAFTMIFIIDQIFLLSVLAKMTASSIQTFNESLRQSMEKFGSLLALLTSAMLFKYVEYLCLAGIVFSLSAFVIMLLRRKTLQYPQLKIR